MVQMARDGKPKETNMSTTTHNFAVAVGAAVLAIVLTVASSITFVNATSVARVTVDAPEAIHLAARN